MAWDDLGFAGCGQLICGQPIQRCEMMSDLSGLIYGVFTPIISERDTDIHSVMVTCTLLSMMPVAMAYRVSPAVSWMLSFSITFCRCFSTVFTLM